MENQTPPTTPHAATPIAASPQTLEAAAAYNQALAAVEALLLSSPQKETKTSKKCNIYSCAAGGAQAPRSFRDCRKSFSQSLSAIESSISKPTKRKWSEVEQMTLADASPVPPSSSTRDIKSCN
jgi:hypothetical protein